MINAQQPDDFVFCYSPPGWTLSGSTCVSPKQGKHKETASVLHRFHFSSALKRMSAIVKVNIFS